MSFMKAHRVRDFPVGNLQCTGAKCSAVFHFEGDRHDHMVNCHDLVCLEPGCNKTFKTRVQFEKHEYHKRRCRESKCKTVKTRKERERSLDSCTRSAVLIVVKHTPPELS